MANVFTITIFAADKATATMRAINKQMAGMARPLTDLGRHAKAFAKEAGFDRVAKGFKEVGKATREASDRVKEFIAPLAALTGAATIAGLAALAVGFGNMGFELKEASASIGIGTSQLQGFRAAAGMVGIDARTLDGGLRQLGDTMEDAIYGRNQDALVIFNKLGIHLRKTKDGAMDTASAFTDLSKAIAGQKSPQVQAVIARSLGVESLLPILRQGPAAIAKYIAAFKAAGAEMSPQQIATSDKFHEQLAYLKMQMDGLKITIASKLMPVLTPLLESFGKWATANRQVIASNIAQAAQGLADALRQIDWKQVGQGLLAFGQGVKQVVDLMGGWKNAMIGVVLFMNAGAILSIFNLSKAVFGLGFAFARVGVGLGLFALSGVAKLLGFGGAAAKMGGLASKALPALARGFLAVVPAIGEFTLALLTCPLTWIVLAVAAVGFAAYQLYKHWDKVGPWLKSVWNGIVAGAKAAWVGVTGWFKDMWDGVVGLFEDGVKRVEAIVDRLKDGAKKVKEAAASFAEKHPVIAHVAAAATAFVVGGPTGLAIEEAGRQLKGAALHHKNPGNLREVGKTTGFQTFPTYAAGLAGMARQLRYAQNKHHLDTLRSLITRYAPPSENDTAGYIATASKRTGFAPDQKFNLNDPHQLAKVQEAMISIESGGGRSPFSRDQILAAIGAPHASPQTGASPVPAGAAAPAEVNVNVHLKNAPPGTKATVTSPAKARAQVRIDHAMPALGAPA